MMDLGDICCALWRLNWWLSNRWWSCVQSSSLLNVGRLSDDWGLTRIGSRWSLHGRRSLRLFRNLSLMSKLHLVGFLDPISVEILLDYIIVKYLIILLNRERFLSRLSTRMSCIRPSCRCVALTCGFSLRLWRSNYITFNFVIIRSDELINVSGLL